MATPVKDAAWLAWIERLVTEPPNEFPAGRFHCLLDDQPDHLVPESALRRQAWENLADRPLFLHPDCWMTQDATIPADLAASVPHSDSFSLQGDMVWLRDPANQMIQPFWLGPNLAAAIRSVAPGGPMPSKFPKGFRQKLLMAGIVVPEDFANTRRRGWNEVLQRSSLEFLQKEYSPMRGIFHPFHVAALRRYFRHLIRKGALRLGDSQSSHRFVSHNESVLRFFHHQLTSTVSAVAGEQVKPSYVYLGAYQGGAILDKHTDREQCEFSMTLCLDYSPEPQAATPWPIRLHPASGRVSVYQAIGDGLFYRGCRVPHSRAILPKGHSSTSIFFHYVRQDFDGWLD